MNVRLAVEGWLRHRARADELAVALVLGGAFKLIWVALTGVVAGTVLTVAAIDGIMVFRAVHGGSNLPYLNAKSIGLRPALVVIAVASVVLVPPLGAAGCYAISGGGVAIAVLTRVISRNQ
jgi:hypothetical protein